jgi:hypothetical protein
MTAVAGGGFAGRPEVHPATVRARSRRELRKEENGAGMRPL